MADKYKIMIFAEDVVYGPSVELTESELAVVKKLFGDNLHLPAEYGFVKVINVSEEKRKEAANRKRIEDLRREEAREAQAVRDKYMSSNTYGGYSMAAAFQKAFATANAK